MIKQIAVIIVHLSMVSLVLYGQEKPDWLDDNYRRTRFPAEVYLTGFVYGEAPAGKPLQDIVQQMTTDAQADLIRKIRVQITARMQTETSTVNRGGQYRESETFAGSSKAESAAEVVGMNTETYYDPATRTVYAFAVVNRDDMANYYKRLIQQELNKAETAIELCEQLIESGRKQSARNKAEEAKQILTASYVNSYRSQLITIDSRASESALQNEREKALLNKAERLLIRLERIAVVYVDCRHENKDGNDAAFANVQTLFYGIIAQSLSENDCSITDNCEEADYELTLITSATQRSDGTGQFAMHAYHANVKGSLYNRNTGVKTVDFTLFNDPALRAMGQSPDDAVTRAFMLPALKNKVMEKILPKIRE